MRVRISPSFLKGQIKIPPSKSYSHRAIICAALSNGKSIISNIQFSDDVLATINALKAIDAKIEVLDDKLIIHGVDEIVLKDKIVDCNESGSTLRFIIPILALSGERFLINGKESLLTRPLGIYEDIINDLSGTFLKKNSMIEVQCDFVSKEYHIPGNISSQFISGLLFILPLLKGDSKIIIKDKFESKNYVLMTMHILKKFGIEIKIEENVIKIKGEQKYKPSDYYVEGDYSQLAFFAVAGVLNGDISCLGMNHNSLQGDIAIIKTLKEMGAKLDIIENGFIFKKSLTLGKEIDITQTPDLGPILALLASLSVGVTIIKGTERLKIKESNRLITTYNTLKELGVDIRIDNDNLIINGKNELREAILKSYNDHRIAMMGSVSSVRSLGDVVIEDAEAISKSYPDFYYDLMKLGAKIIIE
ncbi:3-phosphoshikimate 1-carboxyvinyltransferase [Mycoplasmatota bacterium]|nr:3-phosphoshikimate 1-carboxyvinyltransferase [Mycoplasmatota bacterium]